MLSDEDTRVSKYQGMQQEMMQAGAQLGAEAAYIEPEILKIDRATIDKFVGAGSPAEAVSASTSTTSSGGARTPRPTPKRSCSPTASVITQRPSTIYGVFSDADFAYPSVTLSDGKTVKLDSVAFSIYRTVAQSRGSPEGDVGVLRRARQVSGGRSAPR